MSSASTAQLLSVRNPRSGQVDLQIVPPSADEIAALCGLSAAVIAGTVEEARRIADRIDAGVVSLQDTFLTFAGYGVAEWESFKLSGLGGRGGMLSFVRKQAVLTNTGRPADLLEENLQAVT